MELGGGLPSPSISPLGAKLPKEPSVSSWSLLVNEPSTLHCPWANKWDPKPSLIMGSQIAMMI